MAEAQKDVEFTVTLLEAKRLPKSDFRGKCDPYAFFKFGAKMQKSSMIKNSLNPRWPNESKTFEVGDVNTMFECIMMDKDSMKDEMIGRVEISFMEMKSKKEQSCWYGLKGEKGESCGEVRLKFVVRDKEELREDVKVLLEKLKLYDDPEKPRKRMPNNYDDLKILKADLNDELADRESDQKHEDPKELTPEEKFVKTLDELGVEIVIFDLDKTACKLHSGGILKNVKLRRHIENVSEDFKKIVPILIREKKKLAIATFTDKLYYKRFPESGYKAGEHLVDAFLKGVFKDDNIVDKFYVVGYFPDLNNDPKRDKSYHIAKIMKHYKYPADQKSKVALFDDTSGNITAATDDEVHAFKADPRKGFTLDDLLKH